MIPVVVGATPMLGEAEDDEPAAMTLHLGDLVYPGKDFGPLKWHAPMEGGVGDRDGMTFELRPSSGEGIGFGFRKDFGAAVKVPTARWICANNGTPIQLRASCERSLSRARTRDGATVAWTTLSMSPTDIAVVKNATVRTLRVDTASSGRLVDLGASTVLLLVSRTASLDGKLSSGRLLPIRLSGTTLVRLRPIVFDEIDARKDDRVTSRLGEFLLEGSVVHVFGTRKVVQRADGAELESTKIDERVDLAKLAPEP